MNMQKNLLLLIYILILSACGNSGNSDQTAAAEQLNLKLEQIEDQVRLAIQQGDQAKALELVNQLVHTAHIKWQLKSKRNSYGISRKYYYDEYWLETRNYYKDQIIAMTVNKAIPTSNEAGNKEPIKSTQSEQTDDNTNVSSSELTGTWEGTFGENQITLVIETITDGLVRGYNSIQGKKRILKGTVDEDNNFHLNEPGDEDWDGMFIFKIENKNAIGTWRANNGTLTIEFNLPKK
jgi:hypothetical protein